MQYKIRRFDYHDKKYLDMFYSKIYPLKKNRISKYIKEELRYSSITGEILLDELLKEYYKINYENLIFEVNKYGKPYIKNKSIFYNISHSFEYIITAISDHEIGIDIEKIRTTSIKNINQFATDKEKEYILSSNTKIEKRLFEIYTLKEAYFKMKGSNLNHIKEVEFEIINYDNIICNDRNVSLKLIDEVKGYVVAICEKND